MMQRFLVLLVALATFEVSAYRSEAPPLPSPDQQKPRSTPSRDRPEVRAGTAQVSGQVKSADSGAPLRQAEVVLTSAAIGARRLTRTDTTGTYRFTDLPAGRYQVRAGKPAYVSLQYGANDPLEAGRPIDLDDGQTAGAIDFVLPRAAVITGQILDDVGEPLLDAEVRAMRYQAVRGQRRLTLASRVRVTDDLGAFRLFGLLPGTYYVSVVPRGRDASTDAEPQAGYAPSYYPGTLDLSQARAVTVGLGREHNISFTVSPVRTARIRGAAVDASGKPAAGAQITAVQRQGNTFITIADTRVRPDGTFQLLNVPPGAYSLQAWLRGADETGQQFGATAVDLADNDIEGVVVRTEAGGTLRGRIVLRNEGAVKSALRPSLVEVAARPADPNLRLPPGSAARVAADWTFELRGLTGARIVRVSGLPPPWALQAITLDGTDVTDTPIDLKPGRATAGVEIILTTRTTDVTGVVESPPATGQISVIMFSADRNDWDPHSRRVRIQRAERDGRFRIRGLPPGQYFAVAVPFVWQGEWTDHDFLQRASAAATRVTLAEAENKQLPLKLSPVSQ